MTKIYDAAAGWRNLISLRLGYGCVFFLNEGVKDEVAYGGTELFH